MSPSHCVSPKSFSDFSLFEAWAGSFMVTKVAAHLGEVVRVLGGG